MNLNFLDPSKLPDRIDSTLVIPRMLHPPMPEGQFESSSAVTPSKSTTSNQDALPDVEMKDAAQEESADGKQQQQQQQFEAIMSSSIPKKKPKLFKQTISLNQGAECNEAANDDNDGGDLQPQPTQEEPSTSDANVEIIPSEEVTHQKQDVDLPSSEQPPAISSNTSNKPKKKRKDNKPSATKEDLHATAWTACNSISFNKAGTYLSSGHASGLVCVHSYASRCLNAVYSPPDDKYKTKSKNVNGTTSLCWNKDGKYLLAGGYGDSILRYVDNSHPGVAWDCAERLRNAVMMTTKVESSNNQASLGSVGGGGKTTGGDGESKTTSGGGGSSIAEQILKEAQELVKTVYLRNYNSAGEEIDTPLDLNVTSIGGGRLLTTRQKPHSHPSLVNTSTSSIGGDNDKPHTTVQCIRHPYILYQLPQPLGGTVQFHWIHDDIGLVSMLDESLALIHIPSVAFYELLLPDNNDEAATNTDALLKEADANNLSGNLMYLIPPPNNEGGVDGANNPYSVLCATFGKGRHENIIYAVTKCGSVMSFELTLSMVHLLQGRGEKETYDSNVQPLSMAKIPGGASAIQITANERFVLVNSCDALRLYNAEEFKMGNNDTMVPEYVFLDPVSKAPWISCDFLLDEYVVVSFDSMACC
jgi:hypothetical protein